MESELKLQESIYRDAHGKLLDAHNQFDEDVKNLYQVYTCTHTGTCIAYSLFILLISSESPREGDWKGQHSKNFSAAIHKV